MRGGSNAVVYLGMMYPFGIIRHLALLGIEIQKLARTNVPFDFYFASIDGETGQNAWTMVRDSFSPGKIVVDREMGGLAIKICNLLEHYDNIVVHTGGGWSQTKALVCARRRLPREQRGRIKFVCTTHSYRIDNWMRIPMSMFQWMLYRLFYRIVIFQCQYAADRFWGGRGLLREGRGAIIPLGCEPFKETTDNTVVPREIGRLGLTSLFLDASLFKFVYLAQFRPGKMQDWLVDALAPVLKQYPNARLILCGMGDRTVMESIRRLSKEKKVEEQVIMPGQVVREAVPWLLHHVNCALVPSRAETFGHNFLEPMFARLPVLGTGVGIGKEIIVDGETGFTISLTDSKSVQIAAKYLLENPSAAQMMGEKAFKSVIGRFKHADVAPQLVALYERLLAG